ncbi:restriction endonuclease subunit S [Prevotella koreensis]|uniref:restriction endonuclease subunit S n=1 Tax=Prevotella koreensis TaxID=2490854 RepID=UPI0028E3395C|nr:restriction endonuclease subunit S [Prevotella koreensis]
MKNNEHNVIPFIQRILNDAEVEWKPLDNVAELKRGTSITKRTSIEGKYPVISGGQQPAYYIDTFNRDGETITVAGSGAYAGFVMYWNEPIFVSDAFSIKADETQILPRYIYHFLLNIQEKIHDLKAGGGVPHVYAKDVARFLIPIPCPNNSTKSLEIQRKIVDILDKLTTLETELEAQLEAELICRKRQYEYYRNRLLSFDMLNRGGQKLNNVMIMSLSELGIFTRGSGLQKKDFTPTGVGCIHYGQIYTYYGTYTYKTKSFVSPDTAKKLKQVEYGDVIITNTSENIQDVCKAVVYMGKEPIVTGGHASIFKPSDKIIGKYLAYYTQTERFTRDKRRFVKGTKVIDVSANDLAKIKIPVPPLAEQERIVSILDKFDSLTNSISEGLPKEIELRRKQYEYYRNELLSFSRIWTHEPCVPTL